MWVIADTHFGHKGICRFSDKRGEPVRPWDDPDEMDEELVSRWNSVVAPGDRVYLLGDVAMNRRCISTLGRLNGRIALIKGNHDGFKLREYLPFVDDIRSYVVKKSGFGDAPYILSHIPIHPDCMDRYSVNVHGHLHERSIVNDPRYVCVSVEQINYTPKLLSDVLKEVEEKLG